MESKSTQQTENHTEDKRTRLFDDKTLRLSILL